MKPQCPDLDSSMHGGEWRCSVGEDCEWVGWMAGRSTESWTTPWQADIHSETGKKVVSSLWEMLWARQMGCLISADNDKYTQAKSKLSENHHSVGFASYYVLWYIAWNKDSVRYKRKAAGKIGFYRMPTGNGKTESRLKYRKSSS